VKGVFTLAVLGSAVALAAGPAGAATPKLVATVSDPVTISLKSRGQKVRSLEAGTYRVVVRDLAGDHNFHLKGPGIDKKTSVDGRGTTIWTVTLRRGTYTYVCDPHASFMKGSFRVK
jgi:plastocyanin